MARQMSTEKKDDKNRQWRLLPSRILGYITLFGTEKELLATQCVCRDWTLSTSTLEVCWKHQCNKKFTYLKYERLTWQQMFRFQFERQFRFAICLDDFGKRHWIDVERKDTIARLYDKASKTIILRATEGFRLLFGCTFLDPRSKQTLDSAGIKDNAIISVQVHVL